MEILQYKELAHEVLQKKSKENIHNVKKNHKIPDFANLSSYFNEEFLGRALPFLLCIHYIVNNKVNFFLHCSREKPCKIYRTNITT